MINEKEKIVLNILFKRKKGLTVYKIQRSTKYHWNTCKRYCDILTSKGFLIRIRKNEYKIKKKIREGLSPSARI